MEILETKERKMNKIKREEREGLHTFSDTTCRCSLSTVFCGVLSCVLRCVVIHFVENRDMF